MGEGFPLYSMASMAAEGRDPLRDWICLSVSLCFCFPDSGLSPSLIFPEIRNSDWGESFAQLFLIKLAFLRQKKSVNRLTAGPREPMPCPGGGRAPLSRGHPGHCFALILLPKNHKYSKQNLHPFLSRLDSFDIGFLRNKKHATDRNWHWALEQYVSPKK